MYCYVYAMNQLTISGSAHGGISFLRDTKTIGEPSELIVALELARAGYIVAKPFGENCRYDLVIDDGAKLFRVQVKTGRLRNGAIVFNTYSTHGHRKGGVCRPYSNQIDFFGVYCPALGNSYLIPIAQTKPYSGTIRVHATKNQQYSHVRWAHPYLISDKIRQDEPTLALHLIGEQASNGVSGIDSEAPS